MNPEPVYIDLSRYRNPEGFRGRPAWFVQLWWLVQDWLVRPSPQFMYGWRRFWWQRFGALLGENVMIRPSARVTYPWKVRIGDRSWIGDNTELYSLGEIEIGRDAVISQMSYLCAATHDHTRPDFPLIAGPIRIGDQAWLAAGCFIAPGVSIGRGAIVGARSVVLRDVPEATIWAGNPARKLRDRADAT